MGWERAIDCLKQIPTGVDSIQVPPNPSPRWGEGNRTGEWCVGAECHLTHPTVLLFGCWWIPPNFSINHLKIRHGQDKEQDRQDHQESDECFLVFSTSKQPDYAEGEYCKCDYYHRFGLSLICGQAFFLVSNHRFNDCWLSIEGWPLRRLSTLMSSSNAGQWMPRPLAINLVVFRSSFVPCTSRGYHATGTEMVLPSDS